MKMNTRMKMNEAKIRMMKMKKPLKKTKETMTMRKTRMKKTKIKSLCPVQKKSHPIHLYVSRGAFAFVAFSAELAVVSDDVEDAVEVAVEDAVVEDGDVVKATQLVNNKSRSVSKCKLINFYNL